METLFVCVGNVGRSQMAEAFYRRMSKGGDVASAGTKGEMFAGIPLKNFAGKTVRVMDEIGYDISMNVPKKLTRSMVDNVDRVIVMAEKDTWPDYLKESHKVIFWDVPDAKGTSVQFHRNRRDQIRELVKELVASN
jgi:arsenate reductase